MEMNNDEIKESLFEEEKNEEMKDDFFFDQYVNEQNTGELEYDS